MGYIAQSMSENAYWAHRNGEKPWSGWTKSGMLDVLEEEFDFSLVDFGLADLKKLAAEDLRRLLLYQSSWHHTSKYYNETPFYRIDFNRLARQSLEDVKARKGAFRREKLEERSRRARASFLVWNGPRSRRRCEKRVAEGLVKGNWFHLDDGTRRSVNANGFRVEEWLD